MNKQTFKEYCKEHGINYNIGNEASRFYNKQLYKEMLTQWKQSLDSTKQ